jgi:uroporphyrinogen-III decarboxylase
MDLNAYCVGHISDIPHPGDSTAPEAPESSILALPEGFTVEAEALGAHIGKTSNGFSVPEYLYTNPKMLGDLPSLEEQAPIRELLDRIAEARKTQGKTILLKASGPYSVLASLVEPGLFYRWLRKEPEFVHRALERIQAGLGAYIRRAFSLGVGILSLADPYANPELLGEGRYREFPARHITDLLRQITADQADPAKRESLASSTVGGPVIHICPHNSLLLEAFGFLTAESMKLAEPASCTDALRALSASGRTLLTGHVCIYAGGISAIQLLTLIDTADT